MNKNTFLKKKRKKKKRNLYTVGCVGMWLKNNYVKMLVGAVARERSVKIHLDGETMHR